VADLFVPRVVGVKTLSLVNRLKETPTTVLQYVQKLAMSIPNQVLSFLKSFYPKENVIVVVGGIAKLL
jgi:hypothetical protein